MNAFEPPPRGLRIAGCFGVIYCHYGFHPIFFSYDQGKLFALYERQPKDFMSENHSGQLMLPQMHPARNYQWLKIMTVILSFALIVAGSVVAIMIWSGAAD
jgi:hypothetical protein